MEAVVRSIPVYYEEYGSGTPILMVHGGPGDHHQMVFLMEHLFQDRQGWRRIYPDCPGMGKTPTADWITNNDHVVEVLIEFMKTVAPNERFVVAGLSYGGFLAQGLVYQQGSMIDGVSLIVPLVELDPAKQQYPPRQVLIENVEFQSALTPEDDPLLHLFVIQNMEVLEGVRAVGLPGLRSADLNFWAKLWENFAFTFPANELPVPSPAPAMIVVGRQDFNCGYREAWALLDNYPRGTFAVLDRGGHFAFLEQKLLFEALTSEWLNRVEEYIAQNATKVTG
jgi:pimeloyl-ACP methyl ester carboxylesterase